jgi:hypothetical protein
MGFKELMGPGFIVKLIVFHLNFIKALIKKYIIYFELNFFMALFAFECDF